MLNELKIMRLATLAQYQAQLSTHHDMYFAAAIAYIADGSIPLSSVPNLSNL